MIESALADRFAALALAHVTREYPNKLDHVLNGPDDLRAPRDLHPLFYGSFDWHSNVHGYWLLATLYRTQPELSQRDEIKALFNRQLTRANVAAELEYVDQPQRGGFERPYGWAWLLMLAAELRRHETEEGGSWWRTISPLASAFAGKFLEFLPKSTYPIRVGTHFNSAFALALAHEYATVLNDEKLAAVVRDRATLWFAGDRDCQAWEPGGDDFLSSALMEAECMRRVLDRDAWRVWMNHFLPRLAQGDPATLFEPATVSDRTDGKIAHLDGLNLSRAWCWRSIAASWEATDARRSAALASADEHLAVSLPHLSGDYAGEHWLATYALLALTIANE